MEAHAYHGPSYRHYLGIFLTLAVLTSVTVVVSYSGIDHKTKELLAFVIAGGKTILVGLIFMHLKFEKRLILAWALAPLALAAVFILAIAPDIATVKP